MRGTSRIRRRLRAPVRAVAVCGALAAAVESASGATTVVLHGSAKVTYPPAFGGVDQTTPIDVAGGLVAAAGNNVTAPSVTTTAAGDVLFTAFYAHRNNATGDSWTAPSGMTEILDANNSGSRSGSIDWVTQSSTGSTGTKVGVASAKQDYGIGILVRAQARTGRAAPEPPAERDHGPGKNTVDNAGGNIFTAGAGTQYYLLVGNATALGTTLDGLLGTLP